MVKTYSNSALNTSFTLILLFVSYTGFCQVKIDQHRHIHGDSVCVLPAAPFSGHLYIPYQEPELSFRSNPTFSINYLSSGATLYGYTCDDWPEDAKTALEAAATIWSNALTGSNTINVNACWGTGMNPGTLGSAGPSSFLYEGSTDSYLPISLAESLTSQNYNSSNADISCVFNGDRSNWYYGTDGSTPSGEYDFVTVALHEFGHGVGFLGVEGYNDGSQTGCSGAPTGHGCIGFSFAPDIYSRMVEDQSGNLLTSYSSPSEDIGDLLTGNNGGLYLNGSGVVSSNGGPVKLYTPSSYSSGSTYGHLDLSTFPSELMKPSLASGVAIHDPGLAGTFLNDMGWDGSLPNLTLAVELLSFEAEVVDQGIQLSWEIGAATDNSHFNIYRSNDGVHWGYLQRIEGIGTDENGHQFETIDPNPLVGSNYYRLSEVDFSKGEKHLDIVHQPLPYEIPVTISPNPAINQIEVMGSIVNDQPDFEITNAAGQILMQGKLSSSNQQIDIRQLPKGYYFILIQQQAYSFLKT